MPDRTTRNPERQPSRIFDTLTTGDGWTVIDTTTGHPITDVLEWWEASDIKERLNVAAAYGAKTLERAMVGI